MEKEVNAKMNEVRIRDRVPVLTKMSYGLGTGIDMWGLWLYPSVAFAVFNIYLGVAPWLVGLALTLISLYEIDRGASNFVRSLYEHGTAVGKCQYGRQKQPVDF